MSWLTKTLSSSIGKKALMSLTGLFLCTFLIVHLVGNFQLFKSDGGYAFNKYAVFMTSFPLIKFISYGLYAMILFHAFWGLLLAYKNRQARPVRYAVEKNSSSWASRNMAILGTILLVYIAVHMGDFWAEYKFGHLPYKQYVEDLKTGSLISESEMPADYTQEVKMLETFNEAEQTRTIIVKDLYEEVAEAFKNPLLSLFYVLAMIAMAYHLIHGFQSAFQTLGWNHPKYTPLIKSISIWIFGILIPAAFAAMPIYFLIK
jgi:succinate dehydrogenase / fumarate reductase cytochrome b subunit